MKGWIDIRVWPDKRRIGPGRRVNRPESLPLIPGEFLRVEIELNRPAYIYVIWLDTEGQATPFYPWLKLDWTKRGPEQRRERLSLPEGEDTIAPLGGGPAGIESLLLLARDEPLPVDLDLKAVFAGLPAQKNADIKAAAWFENGEIVRNDVDRGPIKLGQTVQSDDPILRTQALLRTKLKDLFPYTRAVCFGNRGDR